MRVAGVLLHSCSNTVGRGWFAHLVGVSLRCTILDAFFVAVLRLCRAASAARNNGTHSTPIPTATTTRHTMEQQHQPSAMCLDDVELRCDGVSLTLGFRLPVGSPRTCWRCFLSLSFSFLIHLYLSSLLLPSLYQSTHLSLSIHPFLFTSSSISIH